MPLTKVLLLRFSLIAYFFIFVCQPISMVKYIICLFLFNGNQAIFADLYRFSHLGVHFVWYDNKMFVVKAGSASDDDFKTK